MVMPLDFDFCGTCPEITYYRLLLPSLLPDSIDKILYLDADLIVNIDVNELLMIELDKSIAAVPDMDRQAHFVSGSKGLKLYKELGIPSNNHYFNAGVMLFNLSKWRKNSISSKVIKYLIQYMDYVLWLDQDGLNAVLWNDWLELPHEYNVTTVLYTSISWEDTVFDKYTFSKLRDDPKIVHFTYVKKLWHKGCVHPLKDKFWEYYNMPPRSRLR